MLGTIRVEVPEGCQNCDFFQVIAKNPMIIKHGYLNEEETNGACKCMLDKQGHRLKPLDNGEILIEKPIKVTEYALDEDDELIEINKVHYENETYKGRPPWCVIEVGAWK